MLALNYFSQYAVWYVFNVVRYLFRFKSYLIVSLFRFFPLVTFVYGFFFRKRKIFLRYCFVVSKRRKFGRKEFPVLVYSSLGIHVGYIVHMLYYLWHQLSVFFFCVLFVQNAILLIAQANATESIRRFIGTKRVRNIPAATRNNNGKSH